MKKLLDAAFESASSYLKNAPDIITRLSIHKNKNRIRQAVETCRDYLTNFSEPNLHKVCAVKFIRDLFDEGLLYVIELVREHILPIFKEVILYREEVPTIKRGSTYFLSKVQQPLKGQDVVQLMSGSIKPAKSFFQLVHECVFFWAQYYQQQNSPFRVLYQSVKHCAFPQTFKHFKSSDIGKFKQKLTLQMNSIQYQLEDCFRRWEQTKDKLKQMEKKDYIRQNLEEIYNWIAVFVTEYTNLLVDLKNSYYYRRKGLRERMLSLLVEKKEFLKCYIECLNWNTFAKLYNKYGKAQEFDQQRAGEKQHPTTVKKTKRRKISATGDDPRLVDIKKIYLADYPQFLVRYDAMPFMAERSKHSAQYKKSEPNLETSVRQSGVHQTEQRNSRTIDISPVATLDTNQQVSPPSRKLKSSLVSNGLSVLGGPTTPKPFVVVPFKTELSESKVHKRSPRGSAARVPEASRMIHDSLNNQVYHSSGVSGVRGQRKVNASVGILPNQFKLHSQAYSVKSVQKGYKSKV